MARWNCSCNSSRSRHTRLRISTCLRWFQPPSSHGLHAYNHNLDTSPEYYGSVITTRTYQDRLDTLAAIRTTDVTVCCGGIIGLGESDADRVSFLHQLATMDPHPESVPINVLSRVPGTPLENAPDVDISETVRMIATARVVMPAARVRIAAGRHLMGESDQ